MEAIRAAHVVVAAGLVVTTACGSSGRTHPSDVPVAQPQTESGPAAPHGPRLEFSRILPSLGGDALIAWGDGGDGGNVACGIHLSKHRAHCERQPRDTTYLDVSADGALTVLATKDALVVREVASPNAVITHPVDAGVRAASFSPNGAHVAFVDAGGHLHVLRIEDGATVATRRMRDTAFTGAKVLWASNEALVVTLGGAAWVVTMKETPSPSGVLTGYLPLAIPPTRCADADLFGHEVIVAACGGYVGLFDLGGAEVRTLVQDGRVTGSSRVSVDVRGTRALLLWRDEIAANRVDVVEPALPNPLRYTRGGRFLGADLTETGRLGWLEERVDATGMEWSSYTQDVVSLDPVVPFEGLFHQWSGGGALATREGVSLVVEGRVTFTHYASWAPWAEVVRRGSFSWVSGGSAMLRLRDGESTPLAFDVFGSVEAPRVERTKLLPVPPPGPRDAHDGAIDEGAGVDLKEEVKEVDAGTTPGREQLPATSK